MSKPTIILHHYQGSPYAEKIVAALRVKGLPWYSVQTSAMLPRKLLEPLTHGYRRIPIMQIGNNVYCDTAIILDELERRFPEPAISSGLAGTVGLGDVFASWVDKQLFGNIKDQMPWGATPEEQKASPLHAVFGSKAFLADRSQLAGGRPINVEAMRNAQPFLLDQLLANLETLESVLRPSQHAFQQQQKKAEGGWILGTEKPTASDISVFGILWWLVSTKRAAEYVTPATYPSVFTWFSQMKAYMKKYSHPTLDRVKFSGEEALEVAKDASTSVYEPTRESVHPLEKRQVGELVTVSPNDYGKVPVRGTIVEISHRRVAIRPEALVSHRDIQVVMHFPRNGYIILPVAKAQL
ncbi:hypothetical protein BG006_002053 [Podila minutissima]|uniref:GST N-terminal domain-containing protein n=1 Tax=Podila minutissima TaxID=64525 RepID=A0A9P5VNX2_9FUNG|nr:hypothetical protein BG006_002053 [Podila minutissima]